MHLTEKQVWAFEKIYHNEAFHYEVKTGKMSCESCWSAKNGMARIKDVTMRALRKLGLVEFNRTGRFIIASITIKGKEKGGELFEAQRKNNR